MNIILDIVRVIILSIVEGVTEFLPVSSTGHLILVDEFVRLEPQSFSNVFFVIIQLGAILSVVVLSFDKLNPFSIKFVEKNELPSNFDQMNLQSKLYFRIRSNKDKWILWSKILIGVFPAVVLGLLFDDKIEELFFNPVTVSIALIVWGFIILVVENRITDDRRQMSIQDIGYKTALMIGLFQCFAMIPGTSRSAATIMGGLILGASRVTATEFSFYLAIPTMLGATVLKVYKNVGTLTMYQWLLILLGSILSFIVAYVSVKKLLNYIKKNDFKVFGYYRMVLGVIVLLYFTFVK